MRSKRAAIWGSVSTSMLAVGLAGWHLVSREAPPDESATSEACVRPLQNAAWSRRALPANSGNRAPGAHDPADLGSSQLVPVSLASQVESCPASGLPVLFQRLQPYRDDPQAGDLRHRILERLCESRLAVALELASSMPPGEARAAALDMVAAAYANEDLDAAITWAEGQSGGQDRLLVQIAYEAARDQPMRALGIAANLQEGDQRDALIRHAALQWGAQDPLSAANWARGLLAPELRVQVAGAIATSWAETHPEQAARFALEVMTPGRERDNAIVAIIQRWAQQAPENARSWVAGFPPGELKEISLSCLDLAGPPEIP